MTKLFLVMQKVCPNKTSSEIYSTRESAEKYIKEQQFPNHLFIVEKSENLITGIQKTRESEEKYININLNREIKNEYRIN